ncbi:MAG TPA: NEW3 domain-containing protein [Acidimicrobiia bacterium]|nr:NEW3 domain-containing protein [Acidimicrobiia bacterium]
MRTTRKLAALLAAVIFLVPVTAVTAQEEAPTASPDAFSMTTPYPSVSVQAGEQASFDLTIVAPEPTPVTLSVSGLPEGWTATFRGGGFEIGGVTAAPTTPEATVDVSVPVEAAEGSYPLVVTTEGGFSASLTLEVNVSAQAGGEVTLTPDFPGLRVPAGEAATFSVELRNDTPSDLQFELSSSGPAGWDVTAQPSTEAQASTIQVESGSTATVNVSATSPPRTEAGQYTIAVQATAPENEVSTELVVEVVGSYSIELTTPDQRLSTEVSAEGATDVPLIITNTGTAPIQGLEMSATAPTDWEVTFTEPVVQQLDAGQSRNVQATVTPSDQAIAGDYIVTFSANSESANAEVDVRTTVNPSPLWGLIGIALIALTLAGLAWVFRRFGRR